MEETEHGTFSSFGWSFYTPETSSTYNAAKYALTCKTQSHSAKTSSEFELWVDGKKQGEDEMKDEEQPVQNHHHEEEKEEKKEEKKEEEKEEKKHEKKHHHKEEEEDTDDNSPSGLLT